MPKFHFNIDGQTDAEGCEVKNLATAKCEAVQMFTRVICDEASTFWDHAKWTMTVTDETGQSLFQLQMVGIESAADLDLAPRAFA